MKERYASATTWAMIFRQEGYEIGYAIILTRLKEAGLVGETVRNRMGKVIREGYYRESLVRQLCADLLQDYPKADADGLLIHEGRKFRSLTRISTELNIAPVAIKKRMEGRSVPRITARLADGQFCTLYPEDQIGELCGDLLALESVAEGQNILVHEGREYYSLPHLARLLGPSPNTIRLRAKEENISPFKARGLMGGACDFYPAAEIFTLFDLEFQQVPVIDEAGFFYRDDERFATPARWAEEFGIGKNTVTRRCDEGKLTMIRARTKSGHFHELCSEADARAVCFDLLRPMPTADDDGFIVIGTERYATALRWGRYFGTQENFMYRRLEKEGITPLPGKTKSGHVRDFYPESVIRGLCSDIIDPLDADYFSDPEKIRADLNAFADQLKMSVAGLQVNLIESLTIKCQNGWDISGIVYLARAGKALGFAKTSTQANRMQAAILTKLQKLSGSAIFDQDYFRDSGKLRADLDAFSSQLEEGRTPRDLNTKNIIGLYIVCQNGCKLRGGAYLCTAAKALGIAKNAREAVSKGAMTLRFLKEIAGFLTPSDDQ